MMQRACFLYWNPVNMLSSETFKGIGFQNTFRRRKVDKISFQKFVLENLPKFDNAIGIAPSQKFVCDNADVSTYGKDVCA
mmetsp:Transcript_12304/g.22838  ORF Transcript_12304/g.22838 Transcript_12304/m.22838 type:complete len:80 (-) Transcript_12304:163-402(-)